MKKLLISALALGVGVVLAPAGFAAAQSDEPAEPATEAAGDPTVAGRGWLAAMGSGDVEIDMGGHLRMWVEGDVILTDRAGDMHFVIRGSEERYAENAASQPRRGPGFFHLSSEEMHDEDFATFQVPDEAEETAGDIMTGEVFSVPASAGLKEIAGEMVKHRVHRLLDGLSVDADTLAGDAYLEAGPGGAFLSTAHTLANFETANHPSVLADTDSYEQWTEKGGLDLQQRANRVWKQMLAEYESPPMDPGVDAALVEFMEQRKRELPDQWY